jgi:hypothetical protein
MPGWGDYTEKRGNRWAQKGILQECKKELAKQGVIY